MKFIGFSQVRHLHTSDATVGYGEQLCTLHMYNRQSIANVQHPPSTLHMHSTQYIAHAQYIAHVQYNIQDNYMHYKTLHTALVQLTAYNTCVAHDTQHKYNTKSTVVQDFTSVYCCEGCGSSLTSSSCCLYLHHAAEAC